jgi:hypothetical protein
VAGDEIGDAVTGAAEGVEVEGATEGDDVTGAAEGDDVTGAAEGDDVTGATVGTAVDGAAEGDDVELAVGDNEGCLNGFEVDEVVGLEVTHVSRLLRLVHPFVVALAHAVSNAS